MSKENIGRGMAGWAKYTLHPKSQKGNLAFNGFQEKYTKGGQNGGALVHIAGVAGATLVGDYWVYYLGGPTGYQVAKAQYDEDWHQLQEGLDLRSAGYKTPEDRLHVGVSLLPGYRYDYPLDKYIDEKGAEMEDDGAGAFVGNLLGQVYAGNVKGNDARQQIFDRLCDK